MTKALSRFIGKHLQPRQLVAAAYCLILLGTPALTTSSAGAADATYPCGTYSAGAYSNNQNCDGSGTTVTPPNTGFAKLTEPANLAAIIASLILLLVGIALIIKSRSRKKQNVGFRRHN